MNKRTSSSRSNLVTQYNAKYTWQSGCWIQRNNRNNLERARSPGTERVVPENPNRFHTTSLITRRTGPKASGQSRSTDAPSEPSSSDQNRLFISIIISLEPVPGVVQTKEARVGTPPPRVPLKAAITGKFIPSSRVNARTFVRIAARLAWWRDTRTGVEQPLWSGVIHGLPVHLLTCHSGRRLPADLSRMRRGAGPEFDGRLARTLARPRPTFLRLPAAEWTVRRWRRRWLPPDHPALFLPRLSGECTTVIGPEDFW